MAKRRPARDTLEARSRAELRQWAGRRELPPEELPSGIATPELAEHTKKAASRESEKFRKPRKRERWRPPAKTRQTPGCRGVWSTLEKHPPITGRRTATDLQRWMAERIRKSLRQVGAQIDGKEVLIDDKLATALRKAYVAFEGVAPEDHWKGAFRFAFRSALTYRQDRAGGRPEDTGEGILRWLDWACPPDTVPTELEADAIENALKRATLGRGGSGSRKAHWRGVVDALIDQVEAKRRAPKA